MKVIMLADVAKVGKKGDVVDVSDGYGTNFLLMRRLAVKATNDTIKILQKEKGVALEQERERVEQAKINKQKIEQLDLIIKSKVGKNGKMFGAITAKQISELLQSKYNVTIDKRKFESHINITEFGISIVKISLYKGVSANLKITVIEA